MLVKTTSSLVSMQKKSFSTHNLMMIFVIVQMEVMSLERLPAAMADFIA